MFVLMEDEREAIDLLGRCWLLAGEYPGTEITWGSTCVLQEAFLEPFAHVKHCGAQQIAQTPGTGA